MTANPFSFTISHNGKCLYSYQFIQLDQNEHLLTGLISALEMLYEEIFNDQLRDIELNNIKILSQDVSNIELHLLYTGEKENAEVLMMEILDQLLQHQLLKDLEDIVKKSVISSHVTEKLDAIIKVIGLPDCSIYQTNNQLMSIS